MPASHADSSEYRAMLVRDEPNNPTGVTIENADLTSADSLQIELAEGGGFIGRFTPQVPRLSATGGAQE